MKEHVIGLLPLFLVPPVVSVVLARTIPRVLFPPPPSKEQEVAHCKSTGDRWIAAVLTVCIVLVSATLTFPPSAVTNSILPRLETPEQRLVYALHWEFFSTVLYAWLIVRMALARGADPNAVRGGTSDASTVVEFRHRVLNNSTEQLILGILARLILAGIATPLQAATIVPLAVSLWVSGRILYVIGYTPENPLGRELGFELTFVPSLLCLALAFFNLLS